MQALRVTPLGYGVCAGAGGWGAFVCPARAFFLPLGRSRWLRALLMAGLAASFVAVYSWAAALGGTLWAMALAMLVVTVQALAVRHDLHAGPAGLTLNDDGHAVLHYSDGSAVSGELIHTVLWPDVLLSLELRCAQRSRRAVLVMADAQPAASFRRLAAWARQARYRGRQG